MTKGWVQVKAGTFTLENDWEVEPGEVLVLFGPSGAGKTMTLRAIAGLVTPADGEIEVGGRTVFNRASGVNVPPHHRKVGYVPQQWRVFPHLDVTANIAYGLGTGLVSRWNGSMGRRDERVRELLQMVRLEGMEKRMAWELSGGQQQRVALARALAPGPAALLLDEPFSALDLDTRRTVRNEVREILQEARLPVMLVTHDREEALSIGDRLQVIEAGRRIASGEPLQVLGAPPRERVARVTGIENLLRLEVREVRTGDGLMRCGSGEFELWVPVVDAAPGDEVTVALRADDVMLASQRPVGISARNIVPAQVERVEQSGAACQVTLDCGGAKLRANLSRGAVRELEIAPGAQVWAVVKSSSCVIARD